MTKPPAMPELPPLPEPEGGYSDHGGKIFTPNQMDAHYLKGYEDAIAALQSAQPTEVSDEEIRHDANLPFVEDEHGAEWVTLSPAMFARAVRRVLALRPAQPAQAADDGDVTGQPGPLPETGWDEVPEGAFRKPSPTAGMNLGQRIKHVGGRENAAGYIEFGSVAAVRALVRQYLRDLPTQPAAQEEAVCVCPLQGCRARILPAAQATPEPAPNDEAWKSEALGKMDKIEVALANLTAAYEAAPTPEPVGEPYGYLYDIHFEDEDGDPAGAKMDNFTRTHSYATNNGSNVRPLYTRPAPGVPEGFALVPVEPTPEMWQSVNQFAHAGSVWESMLAAAHAKGADK